ncbi:MAG: hypothetical protein L0L69_03265 [Propionibacterium sp.]|nr:hypothetical protein [Propionibacterium sp.]
MGAEAPQWLFGSFVEAMQEIGATAPRPDLETEARDLLRRWTEPTRHLHNVRHLINVLAHVDELSSSTHDPDVLRVAAWYHGAFLNTAVEAKLAGSDPVTIAHRCAGHTSQRLEALGVSDDVAERVGELVTTMATHSAPRDDLDAQVLSDADLASLAATPQEYKKYRQLLREEYDHVDDLTYLRARRVVVRRLLSRPSVFQSPRGQAWEARARENLEAELAKTDEAIARLDPSDTAPGEEAHPDVDVDVSEGPTRNEFGDDEAVTSTGTIIIRRKHLKKNAPTPTGEEPPMTAGRLPLLAEDDTPTESGTNEDDASSLETAIDTLDVPSRPTDPR